MKRALLVGLCLAAALTTGGTAAPVAAAAPPEFRSPFPNTFHSTGNAMTLETVGKLKVTCTADTSSGEVTGPKTALLTITFTGCSSGESRCQNALAGEIVTERLSGTLGYLNKKHTAVGLDLASPAGGVPMVSFFCGEDVRIKVLGSLIGKITPINKVVETGAAVTLKFAQKEGHQAVKRLLGGTRDVPLTSVLGGPLEESGISSAELLSFAAPIEIVADDTPPVFAGLNSATTCIPGPGGTGTTSYHLSWEAATDNVTPSSEIVYEVYQATTSGGEEFSMPTYTTSPGVTSFDTPELPADKSFYFVVRARDQAGNEDSNTIEREGQNLCE